jgi:L-methionine (R)-S-oxide reductase
VFSGNAPIAAEKPELYLELRRQLISLLACERDAIANAANTAALLYHSMPDVNWVGFYFLKDSDLVLGPFQGKPACVRIPPGKGVCGTAAARGTSLLVPDVHAFPGHIACDAASRSELVVPLVKDGAVWGVLDLDSPMPGRFDEADRAGCESLAAIYLESFAESATGCQGRPGAGD